MIIEMLKWSIISFGGFFLLLIGTEMWFRDSKYDVQPEPYDTEVNRRSINIDLGWPEYLAGDGEEYENFGVLISNSQGTSYEIPDDNLIYFKYLKDSLQKVIPNLKMANWSVPGIRTIDLELLTLQAKERGADFIIFVIGPGNLDVKSDVNLDFSSTDVNLLAGKPSFWSMEEFTIYGETVSMDDRIKRFIELNSSLVRSKEKVYEYSKLFIPLEEHLFYFGNYYRLNIDVNEDDLNAVWKTLDEPTKRDSKKRDIKWIFKKDVQNDHRVSAGKTLAQFNENTQKLYKDGDTKIFYVLAPGPHFTVEGVPRPSILNVAEVFESMPIDSSFTRRYSLWNSVDKSMFHKNSTHLNESGHLFFSSLLFSLIENEF